MNPPSSVITAIPRGRPRDCKLTPDMSFDALTGQDPGRPVAVRQPLECGFGPGFEPMELGRTADDLRPAALNKPAVAMA